MYIIKHLRVLLISNRLNTIFCLPTSICVVTQLQDSHNLYDTEIFVIALYLNQRQQILKTLTYYTSLMALQTLVPPDPGHKKERSLLTLPPEKGPLSWHINGDRYPAHPSSRYLFPNSVSSQPRSRRVIPYGGAFVMRRRAHGHQRTGL